MATTQVVLGLLAEEAADRSAILRRYKERFSILDLTPSLARPRLRRDEHGKLQPVTTKAVGTVESKIEAALVSLQERGLIATGAGCRDPRTSQTPHPVYAATSAGRAHFEWWLGDAATLDTRGSEFLEKLLFCDELRAPRLIEVARSQELLCLERLEELRCSIERMSFARCSIFEELWEAMIADEEPMNIQYTVVTVQRARWALGARQALGDLLGSGEEDEDVSRAVE